MSFMEASEGTDPAWFGIAALLHQPFAHQLREYLAYLEKRGVENRPIISGNFIRQPCIAAYCEGERPEDYFGAEATHTRGFFIGVHQIRVEDAVIDELAEIMLSFPFRGQHTVLVTGSSGMLGQHVRDVVEAQPHKRLSNNTVVLTESGTKYVFADRHEADLCSLEQVRELFVRHTPTQVLHCAAKLQSIAEMTQRPVDFWLQNVTVNNNVLQAAHEARRRTGPVKVVSVLSTVMFPKDATFPVTAGQIHAGPPPQASESYAWAKRALDHLVKWYRMQHKANFVTVLPGNFYGAYGDFNAKTAPLVNALIAKAEAARLAGEQSLPVMGTGKPERQVMYAGDLARVLMWALDNLDQDDPLIVAGPEVSIAEIANVVSEATGLKGSPLFDPSGPDGPLKRTADTSRFNEMNPNFVMVPLREGVQKTLQWFRDHSAA